MKPYVLFFCGTPEPLKDLKLFMMDHVRLYLAFVICQWINHSVHLLSLA